MTKRRALQILIENAAANIRGTSQGIRPEKSREQRAEVRAAIEKIYQDGYGYPFGPNEAYNLGL